MTLGFQSQCVIFVAHSKRGWNALLNQIKPGMYTWIYIRTVIISFISESKCSESVQHFATNNSNLNSMIQSMFQTVGEGH